MLRKRQERYPLLEIETVWEKGRFQPAFLSKFEFVPSPLELFGRSLFSTAPTLKFVVNFPLRESASHTRNKKRNASEVEPGNLKK